MRVLVTGAYGLIGSAILARLHREGHQVVGTGREIETARRRFPDARWIAADFDALTTADAWRPLLDGIDAVVNCAGALQTGARDDLRRVHAEAPLALFEACAESGPRRVIQVSAVGADERGHTEFAATKGEADAVLAASDLDWIILRPGLVIAPGVYGATAMLRGLAGIPWRTPLTNGGSRVQVVAIEDVVATVIWALGPGLKTRGIFELVHPKVMNIRDLVIAQRRWLGFPRQPVFELPPWLASFVSRGADWLGHLGWRSPARSTASAQLSAGVTGNPAAWLTATGIRPMSLPEIFAAHPATIQDRWFARLYFVKPLALGVLAIYWMLTGLIALGPGWSEGVALMTTPALPSFVTELTIVLGAALDIALGLMLLVRPLTRDVLIIMLAVCIPYLIAATVIDPGLWLDPLGRLMKTVPVMIATLFTLAVLDER
jgi:uncharacterized protein YbjT (DUF2867 family)